MKNRNESRLGLLAVIFVAIGFASASASAFEESLRDLPVGTALDFHHSQVWVAEGERCAQIAEKNDGSFCYICFQEPNQTGGILPVAGLYQMNSEFQFVDASRFYRNTDASRFSSKEAYKAGTPSKIFGASALLGKRDDASKAYLQCTSAATQSYKSLSILEFTRSLQRKGIQVLPVEETIRAASPTNPRYRH